MFPQIIRILSAAFAAVLLTTSALAQSADDIKIGLGNVEPLRIAGNPYYVGSSDATSYLIVTSEGNIHIDTGMKEMVPQVSANIEKLGYKLADIKIILSSHAHFDHAGGVAEMKRLTKARLLASELDAPLRVARGLGRSELCRSVPFRANDSRRDLSR
jgi:metallo-beta-lactamase class B